VIERRPAILLGLTGLRIDGGIATVSRSIVRALDEEIEASTLSRVDRVLLLDDPENAPPLPKRGDQWLSRGQQARFVWQLWRTFRHARHDLVVFDFVGLARAILLPLPGFPPPNYAVFVHGLELETARRGSRARALRQARILLANSEFTAAALRRMFPELADRIRVVTLCIDPEKLASWELSKGAPIESRAPAALIVGRMWSEERGKGHDELIAAWPAVRARIPAAELWVVGGGNDRPRLEAKAQQLGLANAVRFLGRVPDAELGNLYRRASLYAMPSRQEGFGLAYAEAMSHGLPCLGSTADAAGQVIVDGETGRLVPYGDVGAIAEAVVALMASPERAARMGEAGRRRARAQFSYDRFRFDLLAALKIAGEAALQVGSAPPRPHQLRGA
jgi:phosphatidylinositol alpha-1,6-mannosyltransferase